MVVFFGLTHAVIAGLIAWRCRGFISPLGMALCVIAAIVPDIDHRKSILGRYLNFGMKHRGWTHSLIGFVGFTSFAFLAFRLDAVGFAIGYLSHLALDTLNPSGIPWLFPWKSDKYYIIGIPTSIMLESAVIVFIILYAFNNWKPV